MARFSALRQRTLIPSWGGNDELPEKERLRIEHIAPRTSWMRRLEAADLSGDRAIRESRKMELDARRALESGDLPDEPNLEPFKKWERDVRGLRLDFLRFHVRGIKGLEFDGDERAEALSEALEHWVSTKEDLELGSEALETRVSELAAAQGAQVAPKGFVFETEWMLSQAALAEEVFEAVRGAGRLKRSEGKA